MSRFIPHIVFFIAYAGLLLMVGFAAEQFAVDEKIDAISWVIPFLSAPLALLVARRFGDIRSNGVVVTSALLLLFVYLTTVAILVAVAAPVVPVDFGYISRAAASVFTVGGWGWLWNSLIIAGAPLLWSIGLLSGRRAIPRAAA